MSPFTPEVLRSVELLRRAIADVAVVDAGLGDTLTAVTDDMVYNLEQQMLLIFCNVDAKKKEEEALLLRGRTDEALLSYYESIVANRTAKSDRKERSSAAVAPPSDFIVGAVADGRLPGSGPPGDGSVETKVAPPEIQARRACAASMYLVAEAVAHTLQAERASVYLLQKGTGALRIVTNAPDATPVRRGAYVASHQGIPGTVFTTGVAVRADVINEENRRNYVAPVDSNTGFRTFNVLAVPIVDPYTNAPIGVLEIANKAQSKPWSVWDEAFAYHAATVVMYVATRYDIDWHAGATLFLPAPLHVIKPYSPAIRCTDLDSYEGAADERPPQLIVRVTVAEPKTALPAVGRSLMVPRADGGKPASVSASHANSNEVLSIFNVKEMRSFLTKLEEAHRHVMSELVAVQEREIISKADGQRKSLRIRALEDNVSALHAQLIDAKQLLMQQSFAPRDDANSYDYGFGLATASTSNLLVGSRSSLVVQSSSAAPTLGSFLEPAVAPQRSPSGTLPPLPSNTRPYDVHLAPQRSAAGSTRPFGAQRPPADAAAVQKQLASIGGALAAIREVALRDTAAVKNVRTTLERRAGRSHSSCR